MADQADALRVADLQHHVPHPQQQRHEDQLTGDEIYAGNVAKQFKPAEAFAFLCAAA